MTEFFGVVFIQTGFRSGKLKLRSTLRASLSGTFLPGSTLEEGCRKPPLGVCLQSFLRSGDPMVPCPAEPWLTVALRPQKP